MKRMFRCLILAAILLAVPALNLAYADATIYGAGITAYGTLGATYYQGVTESWITESGTISKTTYAVEGTFSGFGGPSGIVSGNFSGTGTRTDTQSTYNLQMHGLEMNGGVNMVCAAGITGETTGALTNVSGVVEQGHSLSQSQTVLYPFPGSYGTQSYNVSQYVKVQLNIGTPTP